MRSRGVDSDYIDYVIGHVVDTYHDIQSKGRRVPFATSNSKAGVSVGRQTRLSMLDVLKEFARACIEPEKIPVKEAFVEPQMGYLDPAEQQLQQVQQLPKAPMRRFVEEAATASKPLEST